MKSSRDNQRKLFTNSWDHPWAVSVWIRPQTDTEIRTGRQATTTQVPDCVYVGGRGGGAQSTTKGFGSRTQEAPPQRLWELATEPEDQLPATAIISIPHGVNTFAVPQPTCNILHLQGMIQNNSTRGEPGKSQSTDIKNKMRQ